MCDNDLVVVIEAQIEQVRDIFYYHTKYSTPKVPRGL